MPAAVPADVQLRRGDGLVPGDQGHAPLLRQCLQGKVNDVPRQSLLQWLHLHPFGLPGHALRGLPGGVLALLHQERAAVQGGCGQCGGAHPENAAGYALHLVEGHQLPLREEDAAGDALP